MPTEGSFAAPVRGVGVGCEAKGFSDTLLQNIDIELLDPQRKVAYSLNRFNGYFTFLNRNRTHSREETVTMINNDININPIHTPVIEEFVAMNFSEKTIDRLRLLLDAEAVRPLTFQEQAELDAFIQAAFYIRMTHAA